LTHRLTTLSSVAYDLARLLVLGMRSRRELAAENHYLRKQLALFRERKVKPHRVHDSTRLIMVIVVLAKPDLIDKLRVAVSSFDSPSGTFCPLF
jgi:hypothetical protein